MINEGRAFGNTVAMKHLLKALISKGVLTRSDVEKLHDGAQDELREIKSRGVLSDEGCADAARAIGFLYILE